MLLRELIRDGSALFAMTVEEVAFGLLYCFNNPSGPYLLNRDEIIPSRVIATITFGHQPEFPSVNQDQLRKLLAEAFNWLQTSNLIADHPSQANTGARMVTRKGAAIKTKPEFAVFLKEVSFPKQILHPLIVSRTWPAFERGDYDLAMFTAMKEAENMVRIAAGLAATDIGVALMRKAFHKDTGALSDKSLPDAEREALAHLAAGAIGYFKNPHSHRSIALNDPTETITALILASHLLGIAEAKISKP